MAPMTTDDFPVLSPASCWPAKSRSECALGHPLSTRQMVDIVDWRRDAAGEKVADPRTGELLRDTTQVPAHMPFPDTTHDPTSMVLVDCTHGLPVHPLFGTEAPTTEDPKTKEQVLAGSFIRLKHLRQVRYGSGCPIDKDEPAPDDLVEPADHPCLR